MNWTTNNLNELLAQIWPWLEHACPAEGNPLRTPVFGTANDHEISLRTVVLRQVNPVRRELVCHSDCRARKSWEIRKNPQVRWLFYHPGEQIQIRAGGTAIMHQNNDVARAAWERTPLVNRRNYGTVLAPGTRLPNPDDGQPDGWESGPPTREETEVGWPNFAVIVTTVDQLEWLHVRPEGHRRAGFTWVGAQFSGHWLVP